MNFKNINETNKLFRVGNNAVQKKLMKSFQLSHCNHSGHQYFIQKIRLKQNSKKSLDLHLFNKPYGISDLISLEINIYYVHKVTVRVQCDNTEEEIKERREILATIPPLKKNAIVKEDFENRNH